MAQSEACVLSTDQGSATFLEKLNGVWHKRALQVYMVVVMAHWGEHLAQAVQVYMLNWPRPQALGLLGLWYPWLVASETLHYGYAFVMLVGLWYLRTGFIGRSHLWWMIAFWVQFWHHIEHALLQGQVIFHHNLLNSPIPLSIVQIWVPRVELHLFYNTVVFIPMVIAMYFHMFPTEQEEAQHHCTCSWHPRFATA